MHFRMFGRAVLRMAITLLSIVLLTSQASAEQIDAIDLHAGAVRTFEIGKIDRVAVGNDSVLGTSVLENGQLLLIGLAPGDTDLRVWLHDGSSRFWQVMVTARNISGTVATVSALLSEYPSIVVRSVNDVVLVEGNVPPERIELLNALISKVPGVVSLLIPKSVSLDTLIRSYPGLRWHEENGTPVIEGELSPDDFESYKKTLESFPGVLSLARKTEVAVTPMVRVSMRLLEVNRDESKRYGINWDDTFNGPSVGSTGAFRRNPFYRIVPQGLTNPIVDGIGVADYRWQAYVGWTTEIFSIVELMAQDNSATILAEPNLTTRSGATASFLAGGELPYPVLGQFGQPGVAFKEYGIKFEIAPNVDSSKNIQTQILVDVSTIDRANAINNVPGLLKRKTESSVTVRSGETIILSGLVSAEELRNLNAVPGLSKIPILGELFKSRSFQDRKTELVVMITPTLVGDLPKVSDDTQKEIDRMRRLINHKVMENAIAE